MRSSNTHSRLVVITLVTLGLMLTAVTSFAQSQKKPNILVIFGDDIGQSQVSAYTMGLMGYRTPNIDRIAREGATFTDAYGQQSCTAGRAAFILGMEPFRTGLLTIGMPGDPHGITSWMPTLADVLKAQGYTTGQFGKNHLGITTNTCRLSTALTNSSAISTTSMPRKSLRATTIQKIQLLKRSTVRVASCIPGPLTLTTRPWNPVGAK